MIDLNEIVDTISDEALGPVKDEFKEIFNQAKSEQKEFVKETAQKIEEWIKMRREGKLDSEELEALLNARRRVVRQHLNTLEIEGRMRLERVTMGLIDIVQNKLLDKLL